MNSNDSSNNWMTIEQAAVSLGLSVRTVNRHITAGKLPSRLNEGRREVRIELPELTSDVAGAAAQVAVANPAPTDLAAPDYETVLALADNAADKAELAVSAYQSLARSADERVRTTRRLSYAAWSLVGALSVVAIVSVGWTSHKLTRAADDNRHLQAQVEEVTALADSRDDECDELRAALIAAKEEAARTEGRLAAYREPQPARQTSAQQTSAAVPTTKPTLVERIASIFEN